MGRFIAGILEADERSWDDKFVLPATCLGRSLAVREKPVATRPKPALAFQATLLTA